MKQTMLLLLLFGCLQSLRAQDSAAVRFRFNHLALSVSDVGRSAAFYKDVLQLTEITNRTKMDGIRWFSLGEGKELHLISLVKEPVTVNKAMHLALATGSFDAFVKQLEQRKIAYTDWPGAPGQVTLRADGIKQIYLRDPDGYWIEVNSVVQD